MADVVVRLMGGLGNQMFQYAAGRSLSLRRGAGLVLDLSWFHTVSDRHYGLWALNISAETVDTPEWSPGRGSRWLGRLLNKVGKVGMEQLFRPNAVPVYREKGFGFDQAVPGLSAPVCLDGYFQSERYFSDQVSVIRNDFTVISPPNEANVRLLERLAGNDAICLHVRRGDYVANAKMNAFHGVCPVDYYRAGLQIVSEGLADPRCYVFSDDPAWVRANLCLPLPTSVVDINSAEAPQEDLRLMAACRHFVIANSSLSWWAAWLGQHPGKRVVAPKQWFQTANLDTSQLIPGAWMRI